MITLAMVFATFCISFSAVFTADAIDDGSHWMTCVYAEHGCRQRSRGAGHDLAHH